MPASSVVDFHAHTAFLVMAFATSLAPRPAVAQTIVGTVYDSTRAGPLSGARVVVSGTDRTAVSDPAGRFRLEGLEPGSYVIGFFHPRLDTLDVAPRGRTVVLRAGAATEVRLAVPSLATIAAAEQPSGAAGTAQPVAGTPRADTVRAAVVVGRVLDAETGAAIEAARVRLVGAGLQALTDTLGWFAFPRVRTGGYAFEIEHIAYGTQADSIRVPPGETVEVTFRASARAIALEPLEVTVLSGVERLRRAQAHPHHLFITREELEEYQLRGAIDVGDALRMHDPNAVRVRAIDLDARNELPGPCVESSRAVTRPSMQTPPACMMAAVVIDGVFAEPKYARPLLNELGLNQIEAVEFLPPLDALIQYGHTAERGAIVINTRGNDPLWTTPTRESGEEVAAGLRERLEAEVNPSRWNHWAAGAAIGLGTGVASVVGGALWADRCATKECETLWPSVFGGMALGVAGGEVVFRLRR